MPDMEKVVKGLECHRIDNNRRINCADCPYYVDDDNHINCVNDLHDDALALLKEQEAKKVESIQVSRNFFAELTGNCPSCKRLLIEQYNRRFCGNCGQEVNWE